MAELVGPHYPPFVLLIVKQYVCVFSFFFFLLQHGGWSSCKITFNLNKKSEICFLNSCLFVTMVLCQGICILGSVLHLQSTQSLRKEQIKVPFSVSVVEILH